MAEASPTGIGLATPPNARLVGTGGKAPMETGPKKSSAGARSNTTGPDTPAGAAWMWPPTTDAKSSPNTVP